VVRGTVYKDTVRPEDPMNVFDDDPKRCPACAETTIVPIVYGPPSNEMATASQLGQIILAPAEQSNTAPEWMCRVPDCNYKF
jgi:hypothetical protein